jgi:PLP dependent protein
MMASPIDAEVVASRAADLRRRVARVAGGREIDIVAVTKGFGIDAVIAAMHCGFTGVGENYAQEMIAKVTQIPTELRPRWHFLGRLQSNKVRSLAPVVEVWQSVDRIELIDEIAKRAPGARVFIQTNLSGEPQKGGAPMEAVTALVRHARSSALLVEGLMGVGPEGPPEAARSGFRDLVALADDLDLPQRSIGMTEDLEVAVEEGSTMVRVGSALFGPRPPRQTG